MRRLKYVTPALMWAIIITGLILEIFFLPKHQFWPRWSAWSLLAVPAVLYWLYFLTSAIKVHRQAGASAAAIRAVVKTGIYGRVRHPIYSADIIFVWGIFFVMGNLKSLVAACWFTLVMLYWLRLEERALTEKFGAEYLDYKKEVPMLVPRFFKKVRDEPN